MYKTLYSILFLMLCIATRSIAQKTFDEGTLRYHVMLKHTEADRTKTFEGIYTFTIKGKMVRKELKLDNGYNDVMLMDGNNNTLYTLQTAGDKKYAIQHDMEEHLARHKMYEGFTVTDGTGKKTINGYEAQQATIAYTTGARSNIYYSKEWRPAYEHTFERLPGATFIPLEFDIHEDNKKADLHFTIEAIELKPIENACFRIGADYKMISYDEYKELIK